MDDAARFNVIGQFHHVTEVAFFMPLTDIKNL